MYDIDWALNFTRFTGQEPMDLHKFALFYDTYIANRNFEYHTTSKTLPSFTVRSEGNQLPHLMGLQHWNSLPTKQPTILYDHLKKGEWSLDFLKSADAGAWNTYRERIEFLPNLYRLLYRSDCTVKLVNPAMSSPFRNRKIDMLFQKDGSKMVYILELRNSRDVYLPTSLTAYQKNSNALKGKFEKLNITDISVHPH